MITVALWFVLRLMFAFAVTAALFAAMLCFGVYAVQGEINAEWRLNIGKLSMLFGCFVVYLHALNDK